MWFAPFNGKRLQTKLKRFYTTCLNVKKVYFTSQKLKFESGDMLSYRLGQSKNDRKVYVSFPKIINLISSGVFHSSVCCTKYEILCFRENGILKIANSRGSLRTTIHCSNDKIRIKVKLTLEKFHIPAILLDRIDGIQWKSCPSTSVILELHKLAINFNP